jgi:hypothetical protein
MGFVAALFLTFCWRENQENKIIKKCIFFQNKQGEIEKAVHCKSVRFSWCESLTNYC